MKIIHTADVHLKNINDERWNALKSVINIAIKEKVDCLVIAGDLFDDKSSAETLRPHLRKIFEGSPFDIIIIAGNHDYESIKETYDWGSKTHILNTFLKPFKLGDCFFWCLPYEKTDKITIYKKIVEHTKLINRDYNNYMHILLFHGQLTDTYYSPEDMGDESAYMPAEKSFFEHSRFDYVLAGHFHTRFNSYVLDDKTTFVYPGSPVSIRTSETGIRAINIVDVDKHTSVALNVNTFYYEKLHIALSPDIIEPFTHIKQTVLSKLAEWGENCQIILTIDGYIDANKSMCNEKTLKTHIEQLCKTKNLLLNDYAVRDISIITNDYLYQAFEKRLSALGEDGINTISCDELREIVIEAFLEVNR